LAAEAERDAREKKTQRKDARKKFLSFGELYFAVALGFVYAAVCLMSIFSRRFFAGRDVATVLGS
jgi:cytochrome c oxidase assembly protein Cox11